jgi:hypothetical protein
MSRALLSIALCCALPLLSQAQVGDEPNFEVADENADAVSAWQPFGELLVRGDRVTGLPAGRADLERAKARARWGARWTRDAWSFGVAAEAALGTDSNRDNVANNDVEDSNGANLDQAWLRWQGTEHLAVQIGKAPLPLELSPLLWDGDLRPVGASLRWGGTVRDFDRWQIDLGSFAPDPLDERSARLAAVQMGWHWQEGAPFSAGILLGYLHYDELNDGLVRAGLGRGNSLRAGRYANEYRLLDAQGYLRWNLAGKPLEARLDRVTNIDADDADDGTRASLVYGDRFNHPGWEFGWAWQRIERDAVLAAVNADDWWFHTAARGHMPWVGYGFGSTWSVRVAAFLETRDGLHDRTERLLVDLEARW